MSFTAWRFPCCCHCGWVKSSLIDRDYTMHIASCFRPSPHSFNHIFLFFYHCMYAMRHFQTLTLSSRPSVHLHHKSLQCWNCHPGIIVPIYQRTFLSPEFIHSVSTSLPDEVFKYKSNLKNVDEFSSSVKRKRKAGAESLANDLVNFSADLVAAEHNISRHVARKLIFE